MALSEGDLSGKAGVIPTGCRHSCGRCVLRAHVRDGTVTRIESDGGEEPQLRACAKGRAYRQLLYAPDRLKFPMRRVGARGEGRFERVSWDEALDTVARELKRVKERYGSPSILFSGGGARASQFHGRRAVTRLLNMFGGFTGCWGSLSGEGCYFAQRAIYGTVRTGNTQDDLLNSRLIILWGFNPVSTMWGTNTPWYIPGKRGPGHLHRPPPDGVGGGAGGPVDTHQARHGCRYDDSHGPCHAPGELM